MMSGRRLAAKLLGARSSFVIVNVAVNLLLLARSYVTMQVLDYRELGLAALLQTTVLLIGTLQFGFLNGGYRLLCSAEGEEARRINNLVYTFLGALGLAALLAGLLGLLILDGAEANLIVLLGILGGIATLGRTWMSNQMVAASALTRLNRINLVSGVASVAVLGFIPLDPLAACLAAVIAQPITFVTAAALADRALLPSGASLSRPLVREVMRAGFITFLAGLFLQLNLQIERWYVTAVLGLDALGHLYLALLFVTLFQMVPTSLDQIYLPPVARAYRDRQTAEIGRNMAQFLLVTIGSCAVAALAILLLAEPVTRLLLPNYVGDLRYLYLLAPGLILFTLSGPFALLFSVVIRYRYYFYAYGAGALATLIVFAAALLAPFTLDLDAVMVARSAVYVLMAAIIMIGYTILSREFPQFRLNPRALAKAGR